MKRFKKSLATLLVLVFVLSIVSTGFAATQFSDVTDEDLSDAIERLVALNIIEGYPDGTFKPNNNITRAEFAKIVVTAMGLGNAAQYAQGMTKFKDVASTHWASGYIKVASDLGVVNGYPDGTFKPSNNVTYAEAITMIVRALGYEPKAKALGGYPGGYLAVAAEKEITEGLNVVGNLPATRGDVAKMVDNSLEVPLMVQKTWGQYPEYEEDDTKSLLKTKLGVDVVEGTLSDYDEDENVVTIGNKEYKVAEGISVKALLNNYVSAWKLNGKIVYVKAESNTIYEYVTAYKASNGKVTEITVKFADKKYKVKEDAEIKLNGEVIAEDHKADLKGTYGKIVLDDNKVIYADLYKMNYISAAKVVSVDADDEVVEYYKEDPDSVLKLRLEDKDVTVIKNNKAAKLEDLKKGDVISVYRSDDRESFVIVATDAELEGKLTAVREEDGTYKVRIDGTYYKIDSPFLSKDGGDSFVSFDGEDSLDDFFGEKVVAYKDYKGDIVYIVAEVEEKTTTFLGIITNAWRTYNTYVKVFKADGTVATYVYDDDQFDLNDLDYKEKTVFEFEIDEDGVVQSIKALTPVDIVDKTVKFDEDEEAVTVADAVYYVGSKTVFFDATGDDLDVIKWDKIKGLTGSGISAKVYLNAKNEIRAMVFTDGLDSIGKDDTFYAFVADKVRSGSNKYTLTLETADDEMDVVFDSAKLKGAQINDIVKVKMLKDGKGEIEVAYGVEDIEKTYIVKDKDGSRYIRLAENKDDTGTWYKVDNKVLVYDATDEDEYEKVSMNHIAKYDKVKVVIDEDGNNVVKAIFLVEE